MFVTVEIWVDGACSGNPGPGGWAALIREGDKEHTLSGAEPHTTNQRMELTAAINGLESLKEPREVKLYSDSEYLVNGMNQWIHRWIAKGWKTASKKPVDNQDLWQKLYSLTHNTLFSETLHHVEWIHVAGYAGHPENELVNQWAQEAAERYSGGWRRGK